MDTLNTIQNDVKSIDGQGLDVSLPAQKKTNGNQYRIDPRQKLFLTAYLSPHSDTFSNAYQSAIKAGYSKNYAKVIKEKGKEWMNEKVFDRLLLNKAERNLSRFLDANDDKIGLDATKFVASRLGKAKWSERAEISGKDGAPLVVISPEIAQKYGIKATENKDGQTQPTE